MPLPADHYPYIYFYDVSKRWKKTDPVTKLNAKTHTIKFKSGSTKGRGPGEYFLLEGYTSSGQKLTKFTSKAMFHKLKNKGRSPKKSRSLKKSKKSRSSTSKKSRSLKRSKKSKTSCSRMSSGKRRSRKQCKSPCNWVTSRKKTKSGKKKKSYCRS